MKKENIYLLPIVNNTSNEPLAPAYVRLLLPYTNNPSLTEKWNFIVAQNNKLPALHETDFIIIERDAAGTNIETISDWMRSWRAEGKKIILEIDDDLFNVKDLYSRTHCGKWTASQIINSVKWLAHSADAIITSTPYLKQLASGYNQNVFLLPNFLDPILWNINKNYRNKQTGLQNSKLKIGYVGSTTHHNDLAIIVDTMKRIEQEFGDHIEIEVIGAFQKHLEKPLFGEAIPLDSNTSYPDFAKWVQKNINWDIAVIPLDEVPFNKSKSHLKYLECTAMGAACICSNVSTFSSIVENNKNGLLVNNTSEEWYSAIKTLIQNPVKRKSLAQVAYQQLADKHTTHANTKTYQQILSDITKLSRRTDIPKIPSQSTLERYLIKHWGRIFRLLSKLIDDPHHYFADSKHRWLKPLRHIFPLKN